MIRLFATAALLALTAATAQAGESLTVRVHNAAVEACAPERSASLPVSHYGAIDRHCIDRISSAALRQMAAVAQAKTEASTAALVGN